MATLPKGEVYDLPKPIAGAQAHAKNERKEHVLVFTDRHGTHQVYEVRRAPSAIGGTKVLRAFHVGTLAIYGGSCASELRSAVQVNPMLMPSGTP